MEQVSPLHSSGQMQTPSCSSPPLVTLHTSGPLVVRVVMGDVAVEVGMGDVVEGVFVVRISRNRVEFRERQEKPQHHCPYHTFKLVKQTQSVDICTDTIE